MVQDVWGTGRCVMDPRTDETHSRPHRAQSFAEHRAEHRAERIAVLWLGSKGLWGSNVSGSDMSTKMREFST